MSGAADNAMRRGWALDALPHGTRPMTPDDLEIVRQIDRDAFDAYHRQSGRLTRTLRLRTADNMAAAFARPYPGVVIEAPRGQVAGYCFTHVWGAFGWLGTLGITPQKQGLGLGRVVIRAGLELLAEAGCTVHALETMPESGKNLALYVRQGLEPGAMTFLCQIAPHAARQTHFTLWRDGDESVRAVGERLLPGWDATPAARWLLAEEAGDTLVWHDESGAPVCFAALRRAPRRQGNVQSLLTVEAAACLPDASPEWPRYLAEMQAHALEHHKAGLVLPVSGRQSGLLRSLLASGAQIVHTRVRLAHGALPDDPDMLVAMTLAM